MAKKFDFLSPGIEIREVDQSFLPVERDAEGPIIIGRTRKGPGNKPVKVRTLDDFISVFGRPVPGGTGDQGDMWREGNLTGPTYASYAAQAWLASEQSPVTVVRLMGEQHPQASTSGRAGWQLSGSRSSVTAENGTAYGLFIIGSSSMVAGETAGTGSLAAVFYANKGYLALSGTAVKGRPLIDQDTSYINTAEAGTFIQNVGDNCEFKMEIRNAGGTIEDTLAFNFNRNSSKYIRSVFNTNPQLVNETTITSGDRKTYFLGETFAREVDGLAALEAGKVNAVLLPLQSGSINWGSRREGASEPRTGFVISQMEKGQIELFRLKGLHDGEEIQKEYMIAIEDIREPSNPNVDAYGTFSVCIKTVTGQTVEQFSGLNLNPASPNYIGRRIGDQFIEWDEQDRRFRTYGDYPNNSDIVYVDIKENVKDGGGQGLLPAGFKGPVRPKGFTLLSGSANAQDLGDVINNGVAAAVQFVFPVEPTHGTGQTTLPAGPKFIEFSLNNNTASANTFRIFFTSGSGAPATDPTFVSPSGSLAGVAEVKIHDRTSVQVAGDVNTLLGTVVGNDYAVTITNTTASTITAKDPGSAYIISASATDVGDVAKARTELTTGTDTDSFAGAYVSGEDSVPSTGGRSGLFVAGPLDYTASFNFPKLPLRTNGTQGGAPDPYRAYYGIRPKISSTSTQFDPDYVDYIRRLPQDTDTFAPGNDFEHSFIFTLDDLIVREEVNTVTYTSGAFASSNTPENQSYTQASGTFGGLLDLNIRQFMMPLFGGFEGLDITEKEPFRTSAISATRNDKSSYLQYSLFKAIDSVKDPEVVPANLLLVPGIRNPVITNHMIQTAESRRDVLAIIDLENDYLPRAERLAGASETAAGSLGSVKSAVSSLKGRNLNSSFACCFYPWVQISDNINGGQFVWIPPSVAGLGAMGRSQAQADVWFAPAGFNRGGLGSLGGSRGPSVISARQRLDSTERDTLYDTNINPIATFPAEGLVIFGQKTLQAGQSALDRINVRRLLLYLKSRVATVARNLLFDQNVPSTWARFQAQVNPILSDTQARFGITEYKLVLDETTTTADLIDRNIMYAKIFIKPARAIEFIVVDFVITNTGADFV